MKIGIISGAGAYTGAVFYNKLINKIIKLNFIKKDEDFPYIKLINYPFKSLSNKGVDNNLIIKDELNYCFNQMLECDFIVVFCFSFQLRLRNIAFNNFNGKIIYLDKLFNKQNINKKNTLVLCSQSSMTEKLFGINSNYLDEKKYFYLNNLINDLIKGKVVSNKFNKFLTKYLKDNNLTKIFLGCTELFCYNFNKINNIKIINPEKLLLKCFIKELKNEVLSRK